MPQWVTPNILTAIGFAGSIMVALGLWYAQSNPLFLFFSVFGFAVQWFGDSLDGRLAYWRNIPRKWYGWALDISVDWISIFYHCQKLRITHFDNITYHLRNHQKRQKSNL